MPTFSFPILLTTFGFLAFITGTMQSYLTIRTLQSKITYNGVTMKNRGRPQEVPVVKRYPKEFKRECIEYVRKNEDIPMSEAADNLGVPNSTLQRWLKQADIDDGKSKTGELTSYERLEFQRLKRENRKLKMEAEILKKAAPKI